MATLAEKRAAKEAAKRGERRKNLLLALAAVPVILAMFLVARFAPRAAATLGGITHPAPRTDVEFFELLDNSGSIIAMNPRAKFGIAGEAEAVAGKMSRLLGTVRVRVIRFGHTVVDLFDAPYDAEPLLQTLKSDYIDAGCDPEGGTLLARGLERVARCASPGATLVVSVASTSWDDPKQAVRRELTELKKGHRVILLVHGAAVHNVRTSKAQTDTRGTMSRDLETLGEDRKVAGPTDFQDAVERWLPERLRANGVRLAGE